MPESVLLVLLVVVPVVAFLVAKRGWPHRLDRVWLRRRFWRSCLPLLALGLYSFYFLSPWGVIPGFLGIGAHLGSWRAWFQGSCTLTEVYSTWCRFWTRVAVQLSNWINGLVWAVVYAFIGYAIDKILFLEAELA